MTVLTPITLAITVISPRCAVRAGARVIHPVFLYQRSPLSSQFSLFSGRFHTSFYSRRIEGPLVSPSSPCPLAAGFCPPLSSFLRPSRRFCLVCAGPQAVVLHVRSRVYKCRCRTASMPFGAYDSNIAGLEAREKITSKGWCKISAYLSLRRSPITASREMR